MKSFIIFGCLACLGICSLQGQEAKDCFIHMPDSLSPLLSSVNRADFIDFLDSKMKAEVTNRLGGRSEMTQLSSDYAFVKMTAQSTFQLKLLPLNDSTKVICTVATVLAPAADSRIAFYTTDWKHLSSSPFLPALPGIDHFIEAAPDTMNVYEYRNSRQQADMTLLKADLSPADATLTLTFTTPDYMEKEAAEKLKPFIRRPVTYTWREGRFQ